MSLPTTPASGFRDFTPQECALRDKAAALITETYRAFGFSRIATPCVEDLAVLMGKGGGENEKLIFKILKRGEKLDISLGPDQLADLGLRFDLTLPLARYYSRHQGTLPHPFKAFQMGPVWRAERAQKGRYREFMQCDVDVLGSESVTAEAEVLSAMLAAFDALGVTDVEIALNDRALLFALLDREGLPPEKRGQACIILDKMDKVSPDQVFAELGTLMGAAGVERLRRALAESDLAALRAAHPEAAARLEQIIELVGPAARLRPHLVRGLDYYTGPVFEFRHPKLSGSLGGGGRYDGLMEKFGGKSVPACGGSIGFERLMMLLLESGAAPAGPELCVTVFSEELRAKTLRIAAGLRRKGVTVDVYPGAGKLKNQFKYADARGAAFAFVMGPDEAAQGKAKIKELRTGVEREVSLNPLDGLIKALRP